MLLLCEPNHRPESGRELWILGSQSWSVLPSTMNASLRLHVEFDSGGETLSPRQWLKGQWNKHHQDVSDVSETCRFIFGLFSFCFRFVLGLFLVCFRFVFILFSICFRFFSRCILFLVCSLFVFSLVLVCFRFVFGLFSVLSLFLVCFRFVFGLFSVCFWFVWWLFWLVWRWRWRGWWRSCILLLWTFIQMKHLTVKFNVSKFMIPELIRSHDLVLRDIQLSSQQATFGVLMTLNAAWCVVHWPGITCVMCKTVQQNVRHYWEPADHEWTAVKVVMGPQTTCLSL